MPGRGFVDPRLSLAQALQMQGSSTAPVHSPAEGLLRALQAPLGGYMAGQARRGGAEGMQAALAALQDQNTPEADRFRLASEAYRTKDPYGQNPVEGMQMSSLLDALKPKAPIKLGEKDRLIDPRTNKEIVGAAPGDQYEPYLENGVQVGQKNSRTGKVDYMPAGLNDRWEPEVRGGISGQINRRTGEWKPADMRPTTTVNNEMKMPPQQTEIEKFYGKKYGEIEEAAGQANQMNARLDRLGNLLEGVNTGKFAGTALEFKRAAKGLGFDLEALGIKDDVPAAEAARALSNEIALQLRNPAGGAGMPGAMSDQDRQFLQSMVPGLEATPEGRKMMIETSKKLNQRALDVAKQARQYLQQNQKLDPAFFNKLQEWSDANPLFPQGQQGAPDPSKWQRVDVPKEMQPPADANPYAGMSDEQIKALAKQRGLLP